MARTGAGTNTDSNGNLLMSYLERKALVTLMDECRFYAICDKTPLPLGSGKSVTWNAWQNIDPPSAALSEYSASAALTVALSSRKVTATIVSYGRVVEWSDMLEKTSILPVHAGALAMLEQTAAKTFDNMIQFAALKLLFVHTGNSARCTSSILSGRLSSRASAFCSNTGTSTIALKWGFPVVFGTSCTMLSAMHAASAATTSMSSNMGPIALGKVATRLRRLNVKTFADGRFLGIIHPNAVGSMIRNSDWKTWQQGWEKGVTETMYKHVVGTCQGITLIESSNIPRYEGNLLSQEQKNLNITFICGQGALGVTELDGGIKFVYHPPEKTGDNFELYSTLAYKIRGAAAVLNPSCGAILITQDIMAPALTVA